MPGMLDHSAAEIIRKMIVDMGFGNEPNVPLTVAWPTYTSTNTLTNIPDNVIFVKDTQGRDGGRTNSDGERQEHHGIQITVQSSVHRVGYKKLKTLAQSLDTLVYLRGVSVTDLISGEISRYVVHSFNRTSDVIPVGTVGKDTSSKRSIFTLNGLASITMLESGATLPNNGYLLLETGGRFELE